MPIYEYECQNCGIITEALQGFKEKPLKKCPECGKLKLERMISLSSFHLKGNGWYTTEYGKNTKPHEPISESPSTDNKMDNKTDNKTEKTDANKESVAQSIKQDTKKAKGESTTSSAT